jgi:hypothetical protein
MPRKSGSPSRGDLIDEFAELDRLMKLYKPQIDRHASLKKEILSWADDLAATKPHQFESKLYQVQLSPRKNKSWITSKTEVFKRLGQRLFIELASITLEAVRAAKLDDLIETDQIGPREIVAVVPLHSLAVT